jgi:hypothetical protein
VFTGENAAFVATARALSSRLTELFGDEVSISHFERMLLERQSMTPSQAAVILIDPACLALYEKYRLAKAKRDAQRDTFRFSKDVVTIEAALASAKATPTTGNPVIAGAVNTTSFVPK